MSSERVLPALLLILSLCAASNDASGQRPYDDPSIRSRVFIFSEEFDDNRNQWGIGSLGEGQAEGRIENGLCFLQSNQTGINWELWKTVVLNPARDFEVETRLQFVGGEDNNANCLFWGRNDQDHRYRFGFSGNGHYCIDRFEGDWTTYVPWTPSALLDRAGFNTLTVRKIGATLYYYLNGQLVHSIPFPGLYGPYVGFQVNQNTTIAVDRFTVAYLNPPGAATYDAYPPSSRRSIYAEDFDSDQGRWAVGTFGEGQRSGSIENGVYLWRSLATGDHSMTWTRVSVDETADLQIEASIRFAGGEDNNAISLFWGRDDQDHRHRFGFSGNGQYIIDRFDGNWVNEVPWAPSGLIRQDGYNTLTFRKVGNESYFFLNEHLVHIAPYRPFFGPYIGFQVNQNSLMAVERVNIWQLLESTGNQPPEIVITEPDITRGMRPAGTRSLRVAGRATDRDGIREVTVGGVRAAVDRSGSFSATVALTGEEQLITVRAVDTRGAAAERSFSMGSPGAGSSSGETGGRRIALLVGNARYAHGGQLANPVNDVRAVKSALQDLQFTVFTHENCTQAEMKKAMDDFGRRLKEYDVALFFYAGHGVQVNGHNYLIPVDATLESENDAEYDCVRADRVLAKMEAGGTKTNIVILDACRDNPFERSWHRGARGTGLAFMNAPSGSLIAYSTSPGSVASDGTGVNGTYTAALLEHVDTPGVTILQMFQRVRARVISRTNNQQIPWESTSLSGDFYFRK